MFYFFPVARRNEVKGGTGRGELGLSGMYKSIRREVACFCLRVMLCTERGRILSTK